MHRSKLAGFIIDCETDDLDAAATFWSEALGAPRLSRTGPEEAGYVALKMQAGEPGVEVQRVSHPSRVHLDIETDDVEREVARLEALGARRVTAVRDWWVLEAPTGQRFCVVPAQSADFDEKARRWG
jgi:predicted enzyme related to lactoylglutathione lyase